MTIQVLATESQFQIRVKAVLILLFWSGTELEKYCFSTTDRGLEKQTLENYLAFSPSKIFTSSRKVRPSY